MASGMQDAQTVFADWLPIEGPAIEGVSCKYVRPVATGSGYLTEIWRAEWGLDPHSAEQAFARTLEPGGVSGWHAHAGGTDRLSCVAGTVRLSLYDGRKSSATFGTVAHVMMGERSPVTVSVPPGVWHGLKSIGATPAMVINVVNHAYGYESPDHWRLPPDTAEIPYKLV